MEIKIIISGATTAESIEGSTTIQIAGRTPSEPRIIKSELRTPPSVTMPGATAAQDFQPLEAGPAPGSPTQIGQPGIYSGLPIQPSAELLRAAAAIGAQDAGPAPMLIAGIGGRMPGEPEPFTAVASEPIAMAALGSPDQPAGAAPGAEMSVPTSVIETQGSRRRRE